jgi:hypothetical protein
MAVLLRTHSGGQAIADTADVGLDATGYRQQIAVLGNEGEHKLQLALPAPSQPSGGVLGLG